MRKFHHVNRARDLVCAFAEFWRRVNKDLLETAAEHSHLHPIATLAFTLLRHAKV
jgi:hypothetical protein